MVSRRNPGVPRRRAVALFCYLYALSRQVCPSPGKAQCRGELSGGLPGGEESPAAHGKRHPLRTSLPPQGGREGMPRPFPWLRRERQGRQGGDSRRHRKARRKKTGVKIMPHSDFAGHSPGARNPGTPHFFKAFSRRERSSGSYPETASRRVPWEERRTREGTPSPGFSI